MRTIALLSHLSGNNGTVGATLTVIVSVNHPGSDITTGYCCHQVEKHAQHTAKEKLSQLYVAFQYLKLVLGSTNDHFLHQVYCIGLTSSTV